MHYLCWGKRLRKLRAFSSNYNVGKGKIDRRKIQWKEWSLIKTLCYCLSECSGQVGELLLIPVQLRIQ